MTYKMIRIFAAALMVAACGQSTGHTEGTVPATVAANTSAADAGSRVVDTAKWKKERAYEIGGEVTTLQEPGDEDTATTLVESIFDFPSSLVNLEGLVEGLVDGIGIDIKERIQVDQFAGAYRQTYLASERGKDIEMRLEVFAYHKQGRQHVLMMVALPERFEALGGTGLMRERFANGQSVAQLTRDARARREFLVDNPHDHVVTTSSTGIPLTHRHMILAIELGDFLAGNKLTAADVKKLYANVEAEWERDPNQEHLASVEVLMDQVRAAPPLKRLEVAATLYREAMKNYRPQHERSALMDIILEHNPIVARIGDDLLSARAVDARMRSAKIVMQLQGKSADQIEAALPRLRIETVSSFPQMSAQQRQDLMAAEVGWLQTVGRLANKNLAERQIEFRQAVAHAGDDQATVLSIARHLERRTVLGGMSSDQYNTWLRNMILVPSLIADLQSARL